jgi:hypothetical protein
VTYIHQALLRDRSLILSVDDALRSLVSEWMPSLPEEIAYEHPEGPSIQVDQGIVLASEETRAPSLALGRVQAWVDAKTGSAVLASTEGNISATADLDFGIARVTVDESRSPHPLDLSALLTITAGLLLVRAGRSAMHAGAVIDPRTERAWLLCGDSHSGKSTTTANLIKAGWSYLSDDYVVLSRLGEEVEIEGWPDDFHIDEGWSRGESTGVRSTMRESELPSGMRAESAMLGGILFPRVSANEATVVTPVAPVVALEKLIRQAPWLIVDPVSAGDVLRLLTDAASVESGELRLGLDTFADPEKLSAAISEFAAREI